MGERLLGAAVVTVGDELLNGETVDTNAAWLGRSLGALGIPVVRRYTVGDDDREITAALEGAMRAADLVLVTGGLGPTPDDRTKEAIAGHLGLSLSIDPELLSDLEELFRKRGYDALPSANRSQAQVPEGAKILDNPHGTAPGLVLSVGGTLVALMPGVPKEMRGIFSDGLAPLVTEYFGDRLLPVHHRMIYTTGVPESQLTELVAKHLPGDTGPVGLAFLPDLKGVDLRLTARGVAAAEAREWFERIEIALEPVLRGCRYEAESGDIAEAVLRRLRSAGKRIGVAESCTGGLVSERLTNHAGASDVFAGGIVAYDNEVKVSQVGVSEQDLREHGAVSEVVARQLALGVASRLGTEAGIGVTGVAGPGGGTPEKPVGTVWIAAVLDGAVESRLARLVGERPAIRERAAQAALALMHECLGSFDTGA